MNNYVAEILGGHGPPIEPLLHDATSTLLGGLCRRLVQLSVCQVRSRINDVCHLAEVNVSILTTNHMFFFASVFQKMTESNVYIRLALIKSPSKLTRKDCDLQQLQHQCVFAW